MPFEIERKLLVAHDGRRSTANGSRSLRDGLWASIIAIRYGYEPMQVVL